MQDPFFSPSATLIKACRALTDPLNLSTLPLHIHEVLLAWLFYETLYDVFAPFISRLLAPKTYPKLSAKTKINWNVRVVSTIQAFIISGSALWVIFSDEQRAGMNWRGRIWGYTGSMGFVQALAAGYFLWDVGVSAKYVKAFGPGGLAHAISALIVTSMGFRPFANYYGLNFVLYALSTPFLNMHWYFDKLNLTGSKLQLYNGIALLITFFCCRVLWGNYQSIYIYRDLWNALTAGTVDLIHTGDPVFAYRTNPALLIEDVGKVTLSRWYAGIYAGSNTVLNFLNVFWFWKMVETVRKRFEPERAKTNGKKSN